MLLLSVYFVCPSLLVFFSYWSHKKVKQLRSKERESYFPGSFLPPLDLLLPIFHGPFHSLLAHYSHGFEASAQIGWTSLLLQSRTDIFMTIFGHMILAEGHMMIT